MDNPHARPISFEPSAPSEGLLLTAMDESGIDVATGRMVPLADILAE